MQLEFYKQYIGFTVLVIYWSHQTKTSPFCLQSILIKGEK